MILNGQYTVNQVTGCLSYVDEQSALSLRPEQTCNFERFQLKKGQLILAAPDLHDGVLLKDEFYSLGRKAKPRKSEFPQIDDKAVAARPVFPGLERFSVGFLIPAFFKKLSHLSYGKSLTGVDRYGGCKNP
jgi:hypothetical protein